MQIIYKNVKDLIPYINNPRNNDDSVGLVASSIKNFGFKVPIVIDSKNEIVAGHTRLLAAKKLNMDKVPCIIADDLDDNQVKAFRLADNKVAEFSKWDDKLLWTEISQIDGLDMTEFGFEMFDAENFGLDFELPDKEKDPFQQMTFMLANEQAELIKEALKNAKDEKYDNFGNTNTNGNALYRIVREWVEQKI
jgi:site-specific DNA-methyltransferase (adenine-specific)